MLYFMRLNRTSVGGRKRSNGSGISSNVLRLRRIPDDDGSVGIDSERNGLVLAPASMPGNKTMAETPPPS